MWQDLCRILVPILIVIASCFFFEGVNVHWGRWWLQQISDNSFAHPVGFVLGLAGILISLGPLVASSIWLAFVMLDELKRD